MRPKGCPFELRWLPDPNLLKMLRKLAYSYRFATFLSVTSILNLEEHTLRNRVVEYKDILETSFGDLYRRLYVARSNRNIIPTGVWRELQCT